MIIYRCPTCGKSFDAERNEICPACGAAVAPSVLTRIERKHTAARLRAEGMTHYDEHCHEDDAWKGSYGAQAHRAAVKSHEAELRAGYRAHSGADVTTRDSNPVQGQTPTQQPKFNYPTQSTEPYRQKPKAPVWKAFLPFIIVILWLLFRFLGSIIRGLF